MKSASVVKEELRKHVDLEKANFLPKYFQAYPGGYSEVDRTMLRYSIKQFFRELRKNFFLVKLQQKLKTGGITSEQIE